MRGKNNGQGSNGKKKFYCYYRTTDGWQLYQPKLDDAGKPTLRSLDLYVVSVYALFKSEAVLLVSAEGDVPVELNELGTMPSKRDLQAFNLRLHKHQQL
jgi:hypothetical protein